MRKIKVNLKVLEAGFLKMRNPAIFLYNKGKRGKMNKKGGR